MYDICPFCKKEIDADTIICPYCKRVVREVIFDSHLNQSNYTPTTEQNITSDKKSEYKRYRFISFLETQFHKFKKYLFVISFTKQDRYKLIWLILITILFFIGLYTRKRINIPLPVIPNNVESPSTQQKNIPTQVQDSKTYMSLPNGFVFTRYSSYLNGDGKLEIENGTSYDAIVKLVDIIINRSIFTVYIQAEKSYTISGIKDGSYKLFFNLGKHWDSNIKAFRINSGYRVFDELFNFTTTEYHKYEYINNEYYYRTYRYCPEYKITLHPVIYGTAKTSKVEPIEFAGY